jgi:hypothetical protein
LDVRCSVHRHASLKAWCDTRLDETGIVRPARNKSSLMVRQTPLDLTYRNERPISWRQNRRPAIPFAGSASFGYCDENPSYLALGEHTGGNAPDETIGASGSSCATSVPQARRTTPAESRLRQA